MAGNRNGVLVERVQRLLSDVNELRDLQDEVTFEVYRQDKAIPGIRVFQEMW